MLLTRVLVFAIDCKQQPKFQLVQLLSIRYCQTSNVRLIRQLVFVLP